MVSKVGSSQDHSASHSGISTTLEISNLTSRARPIHGPGVIDLTELHENGVVIAVPLKTCAKGHQVLLDVDVSANDGSATMSLECTGHVLDLKNIAFDRDQATIEFVQVDEKKWARFRAIFSARQDSINEFLRAARGY